MSNPMQDFLEAFKQRLSRDWIQQANCAEMWEEFDIDEDTEGDVSLYKRRTLQKICDACPVKQECLDDALFYSEEYTFRAGLMPKERRQLMKQLGIPSWEEKQKALRNG